MSGQDPIGASGPRGAELELTRCARELEVARRELAETRADLQRSREQLTLFAGQVGHDLRTPLTAILANAEMLAGESRVAEDADLAWMAQGVFRAARRLDRMIEEVVSYARQGGTVTLVDTDLGRVLEVVLADLAPLVGRAGATVVVDDLPTLAVDRRQVYAVLMNLLTNALRFTRPDAAPCIRVSAEKADDRWRVSVTDNGIGVPAEQQEAMFVLFARADRRIDGSGIGLATVRRVVEAHGGRVGMDSPAEGGTRVWFELPA